MSTVYIAGPMRGIPQYNFPAFFAAEKRWQEAGWDVVNPARMDREIDGRRRDWPVEHYMARDLPALITQCDAIAMLPGWESSDGANKELAVARWTGKQVLDAETMEPLREESILGEADRLIHGDRQAQYGHPSTDFRRTGRMWGAILDRWRHSEEDAVPDYVVALCMAALKISRIVQTPTKRDSWTDLAGYAGAGFRCFEPEAPRG